MRAFTFSASSRPLWALAALAGFGLGLTAANAAVASESSQCLSEICGESLYLAATATTDVGPALAARTVMSKPCPSATATMMLHQKMTNAERLGLGLPLKPPVRRSRAHAARAQASPVPVLSEPQEDEGEEETPAPPSEEPVPVVEPDVYEGKIEVHKADDGSSLGYVYATQRSNGIFKYGAAEEDALKVSVSLEAGSVEGTRLALTMLNSDGPLFGLIQGRDSSTVDIEVGSFNYLYFNGIESPGSEAGSVPMTLPNTYTSTSAAKLARAAESNIWSLDLTTGDLYPQWINSDGSSPAMELWAQSNYMYAGADSAAFLSRYPSPITLFTLHFVADN